ncbi:Radical SAM domain protein [Methanolacinia petrolearia DSM 11571]|uniref:Radical SAM domain protein n=1 Tax=Methanolacinia petrolearia (strain DSM 11571 / OCM 486 / SEBR 4847) TaxID=679926 RepID=E1RHI4_METP4|nr:radical SAM protein [Methanolacinia petrolearia]ADN35293.1 Radical SAM domain protein [Methanolacinia petrolearia DSM 11571]
MKIIAETGNEDIARVYIAEIDDGRRIEFVESVQPPFTRSQKWVLIVSSLFGCPVGCRMCDAGGGYRGKLSAEDIYAQIDYLVRKRFPGGYVDADKFKIQFARMGEPAFNPAVLDVLESLKTRYKAPGLIPSLSTIAPEGCDEFFKRLLEIKNEHYRERFQLQFSIHTTDMVTREWLIPVKTWSFEEMKEYGELFFDKGGRKITLNFALGDNMKIDTGVLRKYFPPDVFLVKITPVNPTFRALENGINSFIRPGENETNCPDQERCPVKNLRDAGYDVIMSIGEPEENLIGSNCGQYLEAYERSGTELKGGYEYEIHRK